MTDPNIPSHNQAPEPEKATHQQYVEAFDAIDLEVQTSGAVEYRAPVQVVGEEWVGGKRVEHVRSQANVDLEMVSASELIEKLPEDKRESLWSLGITPDKADQQMVALSFARECHIKDAEGRVEYQPGSAVVLITTEQGDGGFETASYEARLDRSGEEERAAGSFSKGIELGEDDVPFNADFDETDVTIRALTTGYKAGDEKGLQDLDPSGIDQDIEGARHYLTPQEAEAMKLVAEHYSLGE